MKTKWLKESARDLIALGGLPFAILVIGRVAMLGSLNYPMQFVIATVIVLALVIPFKASLHAALAPPPSPHSRACFTTTFNTQHSQL